MHMHNNKIVDLFPYIRILNTYITIFYRLCKNQKQFISHLENYRENLQLFF